MARKRYKKKRVDYRKGGRVSLKHGGRPSRKDFNDADQYRNALDNWASDPAHSGRLSPQRTSPERMAEISTMEGVPSPTGIKSIDEYNVGLATPRKPGDTRTNIERGQDRKVTGGNNKPYIPPAPAVTSDKTASQPSTSVIDRGKTRAATEEALASTRIPDPSLTDPSIQGTVVQQQDRPAIQTAQVGPVTMDQAAVADTAQAQAPDAITASTMEASQIAPQQDLIGATGTVSPDALADAAQVQRVAPIEGADVEIKEGALTARVVGTLSPQATAQAAQAAGTTLSRVTRAKKQLRNSGMSEEAIIALGNDPEALEDRLMDLTEQERGVIGDLPEEALVSNQLDSLLKGIESGEIPTWASPAVSAVEQMLAERGLEASSVGRDNLFNAIIQSAIPLAQSNAQAIQANVAQTRDIESREELTNVQLRQQTALQNASNVFQMNMAQFSADQQTALSNSKFLQTVGLTEASNEQQAIIQNAMLTSQANLAEADFYQQKQIQNAQAFLQTDMANLNNEQQAMVLSAQQRQQVLLSNQSAENAARQFNATSENQTQQFMTSLAAQIEQSNVAQSNAMAQFNTQQTNQQQAQQAGIDADLAKTNASLANDINRFNAQIEFNRDNWNAQNRAAVEQSNVAWRRQSNTIDTAAANTIAMQNAQNAFGLTSAELSYLWQEARDKANYAFQAVEREADRKVSLLLKSITAEGEATVQAAASKQSNTQLLFATAIRAMFGSSDKK